MSPATFEQDLTRLSAAEDFLDYFEVSYDPRVVEVCRLHILQRFHDYLDRAAPLPEDAAARRAACGRWLERAYADFVRSSAAAEKVFRVFRRGDPHTVYIPVDALTVRKSHARAL